MISKVHDFMRSMNNSVMGDVEAWMKANARNRAWHACAIVKGRSYSYFKRGFWGRYKIKALDKKDW